MCSAPYKVGVSEFRCGQCMPCRIYRRHVWSSRMLLESFLHDESWFVTLTYDKDHLPEGGSLVPRDLRDFLKRLRSRIEPERIRFFAVGEYGEQSWRPHYHLIVFGLRYKWVKELASIWGKGFVHVGEVNLTTTSYVAKYVQKGLGARDARLEGRYREFARMSLRPGIGAGAMEEFKRLCSTYGGAKGISATGDVPLAFRFDGKLSHFGRYLRDRLRNSLGIDKRLHVSEDGERLLSEVDWRPFRLEIEARRRADFWTCKARSRVRKVSREAL